jgi:hypothetical protein
MIRLEFSILSAAGTGNLNAGFIVAKPLSLRGDCPPPGNPISNEMRRTKDFAI